MPDRTSQGPIRSDFATDPDMRELVEFFVNEMPARIAAISDAYRRRDRATLQTLAHQLKGAGGGYGFGVIGTYAGELESALKQPEQELESLRNQVNELVALCERVTP